jgi:hypothetical protein
MRRLPAGCFHLLLEDAGAQPFRRVRRPVRQDHQVLHCSAPRIVSALLMDPSASLRHAVSKLRSPVHLVHVACSPETASPVFAGASMAGSAQVWHVVTHCIASSCPRATCVLPMILCQLIVVPAHNVPEHMRCLTGSCVAALQRTPIVPQSECQCHPSSVPVRALSVSESSWL